jgi:NADP-dependent 3-hydroxy acid dehydrogenase YdfG
MANDLGGTVALVTGASSGIGRATARMLASQGASVGLVARRRDRLIELSAEIERAGGRAIILNADITDKAQAQHVVERVIGDADRLDIVVNAAGLMLNGPSVESPLDEWEAMVALNVSGLMYVTKAALPHLLRTASESQRRVADLVNISSIAGRVTYGEVAVYNLTKVGVGAFCEALRQELTRKNLRVSVIEPGAVDTELFGHQQQATQAQYEQMFAGVEKLHPEDIAEAIVYIVTRPRRVAINEIMVRPTAQA